MTGDQRGNEILAQAAALLLPHAGQAQAPTPIVSLLLEHLLQLSAAELPRGFKPDLVEALVWRWFPNSAPLLWLLARREACAGRFDKAEQLLRRLIAMGTDHSYDLGVSFDPALVGDGAKSNLGACLLRQGKLPEAVCVFKELRSSPTHGEQARSSLEAIEQFMQQTGMRRK
jgi:hypothetical protein